MEEAKTISDFQGRPRMPRTLVVFADGTGNAFASSKTNIWQLYCALDKSDGVQIARYIPGVGTSPNRILRMIDGAIGFGVPANVRKLYRFLCWNWQPGDRIMLFGFSRGAFTVRTLAGLIARQGLMPRVRHGRQVCTAEMRRNSKGAWRAYRAANATKVLPTVTLLRLLRNGMVTVKRRLRGQDRHQVLEREIAETRRGPVWPRGQTVSSMPDKGVRVDFMGVFDTVEAFGMPVEELRQIIGPLIYPLSFSNGICAPCVMCARHALAVDEERLSFRNVSFELPEGRDWQDVKQRWFPGVHSDIGGGYPDDCGSVVALQWMLGEAGKAGLRVNPLLPAELASRRFDLAAIHDSRGGLAAAYRYQPRHIDPGEEVDPLLLTKLHGGADLYGPISLREGCNVAGNGRLPPMPDDNRWAIDGMVFRYRLLNRMVIAIIVFLALYPLHYLTETDADGYLTIYSLGWMDWWIEAWKRSWRMGAVLAGAGLLLYLSGGGLKANIRDTAAAGWQGRTEPTPQISWFWCRGARLSSGVLEWIFAAFVGLLAASIICANWDGLKRATLASAHCVQREGKELGVNASFSQLFDPTQPCPATGIQVRAGQRYALHLQSQSGFCDGDIPVQTGGMESPNLLMRSFEWARRSDAPWLAPIFQIGTGGRGQDTKGDISTVPARWSCLAEADKGADFHGEFITQSDGPLFIYANDVKFLPGIFYRNNAGRGRIFVTRME